jgi:hypothetical protein
MREILSAEVRGTHQPRRVSSRRPIASPAMGHIKARSLDDTGATGITSR